jgi:glycosyltransferase involved in cell wall biosynthesis
LIEDRNCHFLIAIQSFGGGGAERQAFFLAEHLVSKGYKVTVFAFGNENGLMWDRFQKLAVKVVAAGFREKILLYKGFGIKKLLLKWKYQRRLIRQISKWSIDVIIPFTATPNIIFSNYWQKIGAKICIWNQRDGGIDFKAHSFELKALENASALTSNSYEGLLFLRQFTDRPISIIHNGIVVPSNCVQYETSEPIKVVMVANLNANKDHLTLLKAWELLLQMPHLPWIQLLLIGKNEFTADTKVEHGNTALYLKEFVFDRKLQNTVQFTGQIDHVTDVLLGCHIGVFCSKKEGLPNGLLECMAVGMPVIASKIHGTVEALGQDYPYFAPVGDAQALCNHLFELVQDSSLRKHFGTLNRNRIVECFSVEKMSNGYLDLLTSTYN